MTDSEKLARWQGWKVQPRGKVTVPIPDYLNDDAAAMSLLIRPTAAIVPNGHAFQRGFIRW